MPQPTNTARGFDPAIWLATGFWVGFIPWAPGTFGTLLGLPLAWGLAQLGPAPMAAATAAICLAGIPICTRAAKNLGGTKDPGCIVLDEIASVPITFFLIDDWSWPSVVAGFVLHRLFDITKPPPARQLERLPGGLGIMADDWMAGLYSNLALRLVLWLLGNV
ncbi:MAG TPA: phosphatidylglycerophosphatase A [Pirellulales bacterium]|nr:phosphatidylglycerophosphatase A [Pirellulales bacterium]